MVILKRQQGQVFFSSQYWIMGEVAVERGRCSPDAGHSSSV